MSSTSKSKFSPENRIKQELKNNQTNVAVCAVKILVELLSYSEASTYSELMRELDGAIDTFMTLDEIEYKLSLRSGCELFKRYILRVEDQEDFDEMKNDIFLRGEAFYEKMAHSRDEVAGSFRQWIQDEVVILLHGHSRTVIEALCNAAIKQRSLRVHLYITEALPEYSGMLTVHKIQQRYKEMCQAQQITPTHGFSFKLIRDSSVAAVMQEVNFVLVGAEGVVESGGIINKVGTYQVALIAKALQKPLYVAVESFKFVRLYPLHQSEIPQPDRVDEPLLHATPENNEEIGQLALDGVKIDSRYLDYTPPALITLLFTDLGVLTAAAVSDELIKLYHEPLLTL